MRKFKTRTKKLLSMILAIAITLTSISIAGLSRAKAANDFPATGVHTGTLTHGRYYNLSGLYNSVNSSVIEADTMHSEGDTRACFCLSPGVSETTKANAYKSSNYTSGYGIKYYKALMQFYYDNKDDYKDNAIRFATGIFVWRTVVLERNTKGDFKASDYNKDGFKSGFIASMKSIFSYSDDTATNIYNKAYDYIKDGANGKYNSAWTLLKWTASASQTMLTGKKVPSPKSVKIKINKDLSIGGSGISLSGTKYVLREGSASGTKVATFTLDSDGIDTVSLSKKSDFKSKVKYYLCESTNVAGTLSNKNKSPIEFTIDWSKVSGYDGQIYIKKDGLDNNKDWFDKGTSFADRCKNQLINTIPSVKINVKKLEKNTNVKLSGGEFTIYAYNKNNGKYTTKVATSNNLGNAITNPLVTNVSGEATSANIYYTKQNQGKFLIEETKAPAGHVNSKEQKFFTIKNGNGVVQNGGTLTYSFYDEETPQYATLYLQKSDINTNEPIFDAEFTLYSLVNMSNGQPAKLANTQNVDTTWKKEYILDQVVDESTGELTNTYRSRRLSNDRSYRVVETKRPTSYKTRNISSAGHGSYDILNTLQDLDEYDFNYAVNIEVVGDNQIQVLSTTNSNVVETIKDDEPLVVDNQTVFGKVKIKKVDEEDNTKALEGASFEIWEVSKDNYYKDGYIPNAENGDTLAGAGTTDSNGELEFDYIKAEAYYLCVETKAPEGYLLPENNVHQVSIKASEVPLGQIETFDDEEYTPCFFIHSIEVTNKKAHLDLNIHKVSTSRTGKESVSIKGAKFALYKVDKIVTDPSALSDDQLEEDDSNNNGINDNTEEVINDDTIITDNEADDGSLSNINYIDYDYSKLTPLVGNIESDESGYANVPQSLEAGGYVIVETEAPKNYKLADPQYIYIDTETLYSQVPYEIEIKDQEFEAEVKVTKYDKVTAKIVKKAGTGFKIKDLSTGEYVKQTVDTYNEPDVEGAPHELIKSEETDVFYTDETGSVTLPNVLPVGSYQMEEYVAPDGYTIDAEPVPFIIDDEMTVQEIDENTREVVVPVSSKDTPTNVEITKCKLSDKSELEGAKLEVLDENGKVIDSWTSTKTPHAITALTIGKTYTLVERKPADGYVTAESIKFTINDTEEVQKVVMYDDVTKLKVTKSDITNGEPVVGAKLEIVDKDGNVFDSWTTTKEEHYIEQIPVGKWTLRETYAPNAYVTAKEINFTVKDTGEIQKIDMKDDFTHIKLIKVEKNSSKRLNGATFAVSDSKGKVVAQLTTSKDGSAKLNKKLIVGKTYTFTELSAPNGYKVAKPVKYTVENTSDIQIVKVEDEPIVKVPPTPKKTTETYNAPKTGGNAIPIWCVVGIIISLVMIIVGVFRIRRKRINN